MPATVNRSAASSHHEHQGGHDPQQLVAPAEHPGEVADHPVAQGLQQVVPVGEERGDGADDPAQHDAHQRIRRVFRAGRRRSTARNSAVPRTAKTLATPISKEDRRRRDRHGDHQDAQRGGFDGAHGGGLHKTVAGHQLHDQPGHGHRHSGEDHGQGAGHAGRSRKSRQAAGSPASSAGRDTSLTPTNMLTVARASTTAAAAASPAYSRDRLRLPARWSAWLSLSMLGQSLMLRCCGGGAQATEIGRRRQPLPGRCSGRSPRCTRRRGPG